MSNIDKQTLRQLAVDAKELAIIKRYTKGIEAHKKFIAVMTPATMLALLDELEIKDAKIANITAERDALREGAMGDAKHSNTRAAADIYFQLVEECEIPAGGSLVEYVSQLRECAEAGKGE
ncbi:ead/Ea22-like family protein [Enterobacter hormaechei]|nr:ead/Ea22-like family protein [Enterobacter hormaechei]